MTFKFDLAHPYSRYGLVAALLQKQIQPDELSDEEIHEVLAQAIETGLNHFRLTTTDDPAVSDSLRFMNVPLVELQRDAKLIQSAGLAAQGKYLAPSIVTTDGDAKGSYDNAIAIVEGLRGEKDLQSDFVFSRSFAPTTAKINNGKSSQSPPKGSLLEAACSAITTLTPNKPAAWIEGRNTVIVPDLPLDELRDFIELFESMMMSKMDGDLYEAKLKKLTPDQANKKPIKRKKKSDSEGEAKAKSEYRRPRIFNGNYPFAPRQAAFGAAGLLAAIGRWGVEAKQRDWAEKVLTAIAGTKERAGKPLYIVSYDDISQAQFTHHIVGLASAGELSRIIDALTFDTQILSEIEGGRRFDSPTYKLFYLMASRFLQLFTRAAFRDFLTARAEYAPAIKSLFEVYFMQERKIPKDIVESARELGQWLNRTAYFVANTEIEVGTQDRESKIQREKARILVVLESSARSAKSPQDMLDRVMTQAHRLLQQDAPPGATRFMGATMSGEIPSEDALHLLVSYLRLRSEKAEKLELKEEGGFLTITPTMSLTAIYEPAEEGGYIGYVAELPGANTQGETLEETRENLADAVKLVLEANREEAERRSANSDKVKRERIILRAA
jgi:predicted RNase H-like HicB family nuclease